MTPIDSSRFRALCSAVSSFHAGVVSEEDVRHLLEAVIQGQWWGVNIVGLTKDGDAVARIRAKIITDLNKAIFDLPWNLAVHFPLRKMDLGGCGEWKLGKSITLISLPYEEQGALLQAKPPGEFEQSLEDAELKANHALLALLESRQSEARLVVQVRGYASRSGHSSGLSRAISQAKLCFYFFSRMFVVRENLTYETRPAFYVVNDKATAFDLPHSVAKFCAQLQQKKVVQYLASGRPARATAVTIAQRRTEMEAQFEAIRRFFECGDHADFPAISAAMEWYCDSITNENQTFAYLSACIGLEALLGNDDPSQRMDGLSARLSDRYGFLLGTGRVERDLLSRKFRKMLDLRGTLVHARRERLAPHEQIPLQNAQMMLAQVIDKELATMLRISNDASGKVMLPA
ncbi:hypothetical protein [Achromobacter xylosoxidans]|uniref:hypothetical protein n=1 Tax=Alcaligenes xylosoxydans xylosoxydans TaxID=85698 RepID=UPI0011774B47|nr:hypothetical protein [Achromobacter xylosoxidans]